jgi:hypothetical protein
VHFVRGHAEPAREPHVRLIHFLTRATRQRVQSVGLEFRLTVVPIQVLNDLAAGEGAAGVIEKRLTPPDGFLEGGELTPNERQI